VCSSDLHVLCERFYSFEIPSKRFYAFAFSVYHAVLKFLYGFVLFDKLLVRSA
jgi:hypothetical protein